MDIQARLMQTSSIYHVHSISDEIHCASLDEFHLLNATDCICLKLLIEKMPFVGMTGCGGHERIDSPSARTDIVLSLLDCL